MIRGSGGTTADLFKRVSSIIPLDISLFTASEAFSIYGLSSLFVGSQGCIGLSGIEVHRVVRGAFGFWRRIALWGIYWFRRVLNARCG